MNSTAPRRAWSSPAITAASLYNGTTMESPCAAALAAVVVRRETSVPKVIDRFPRSQQLHMTIAIQCRHGWLVAKERLQFFEQGVVAVEHVIERRHRDGVSAPGAKETGQCVKLCRRAVQRHHP